MKNSSAYMGEEKVGKLLWKFSLPSILSLLVSALYNIVDHIFIGYSSAGMFGHIATTVVFPITLIGEAFAYMFGDGTAVFMSVREGEIEGEPTEARKGSRLSRAVAGAISFTVLFSLVIIAVAFPLKEQILTVLGASENALGYALDYFNIIVAFFPAFMLMNTLNAVVRADGSSRYAMAASLSGLALNIILDPIFIYALDWGMKGAAWATAIGEAVSCLLCVIYLFRSGKFRLALRSFIPDFGIIWRCARFGLSSFINQIAIAIIAVSLNILLARYGAVSGYGQDIPIAAIGIETKIFTIAMNIISGLGLGGQPILKYSHGAMKLDRIRRCYMLILVWTVVVGIVATILVEPMPRQILSIFGSSNESGAEHDMYIQYGVLTLRVSLMLIICNGISKMSGSVFEGLGKSWQALAVALVRDVVAFIPLVILIPYISEMHSPGSGVTALLYSAPAADFIGFVLSVILTVTVFRSLKKEEAAYSRNQELAKKFRHHASGSGSNPEP
ncbi:MAG: MATE family efflux transporter [Clostridia bacterium]|nr:MATE family efflux transporter [Clostridia bacterium]